MLTVKIFARLNSDNDSGLDARTKTFSRLYNDYCDSMFNICMRMTGDYSKSKDILQDSFIVAFEQYDKLKNEHKFGGWLKKIVINKCLRDFKNKIIWRELDESFGDYEDEKESSPWWASVEIEHVNFEIGRLPNGCRQVFILFAIEDYSHKDIGHNLGISESTSKTQYRRAKQILKQEIEK